MSLYSLLVEKIILPTGNYFFGSGSYLKTLKEWKKNDLLSEEELLRNQNEKLNKILNYSLKKVPFYTQFNFDSNANLSIKDFPILTKEILRKEIKNLISEDYEISKLDKNHSSGSSGTQSFTYMTKEHKFYLRALQTNWFSWSGYKPGLNLLQFGMSPKRELPKKLKDFFFNVFYVNSFFLSKKEMKSIGNRIFAKKTPFIAGYPSEMNELAKCVIENNFNYNARGIISFGDKLFLHYLENFKKAFGKEVKVIDTYGCAEGLLMACRKDLPYYYIMTPHVYIEIVDDNGKEVNDGEVGNVLVTCLTNFAMPIIRYKLGDMAIKLPREKYPIKKQHNYPLLEKIIGRETDYVETKEGVRMFVTTFVAIVEFYPEIKQFKIIQKDYENIVFEYVLDDVYEFNPSITLPKIESEIKELTQNKLKIVFREVEKVTPSPSGKPKIIESEIKKSSL